VACLRTPAAAEYIGSTESTLERKRLTGERPAYSKIGRTVVYDTTDLDAYLERTKRRSTSERSALAEQHPAPLLVRSDGRTRSAFRRPTARRSTL